MHTTEYILVTAHTDKDLSELVTEKLKEKGEWIITGPPVINSYLNPQSNRIVLIYGQSLIRRNPGNERT